MPLTTAVAERRRYVRQEDSPGARLSCRVDLMNGTVVMADAVADISQSGIRLVLDTALRPGQDVLLTLMKPTITAAITLAATAVWWCACESEQGRCCVGLALDRLLNADEFRRLCHF